MALNFAIAPVPNLASRSFLSRNFQYEKKFGSYRNEVLSVVVRNSSNSVEPATELEDVTFDISNEGPAAGQKNKVASKALKADSTDWIASSLTRRFGLAGGLAWVGFLAFGVVSEQIKTRREVYLEETGTQDVDVLKEVLLPNGISYTDLRVGGGNSPQKGDLVLVGLTGKVKGTDFPFVDTTAPGKRDIVLTFEVRPYVKGVSEGLEMGMEGMRVGGKRKISVPFSLGFGEDGADFLNGISVPGGSDLEYVVELKRVSIPPS